jgi:hypothetical protein
VGELVKDLNGVQSVKEFRREVFRRAFENLGFSSFCNSPIRIGGRFMSKNVAAEVTRETNNGILAAQLISEDHVEETRKVP